MTSRGVGRYEMHGTVFGMRQPARWVDEGETR